MGTEEAEVMSLRKEETTEEQAAGHLEHQGMKEMALATVAPALETGLAEEWEMANRSQDRERRR